MSSLIKEVKLVNGDFFSIEWDKRVQWIFYRGNFKNFIPHGYCEKYKLGPGGNKLLCRYKGFWNHGYYHEYGREYSHTQQNSLIYAGSYKNGQRHGIGLMDGKEYLFENDRKVNEIK